MTVSNNPSNSPSKVWSSANPPVFSASSGSLPRSAAARPASLVLNHRRVRSDSAVLTKHRTPTEESAELALEDIRQCERNKPMAIGAIISHLVEHPQPRHKNWRALVFRAFTNVIAANTQSGKKIHMIQVFGKAWEKLLRRGVKTDLIRFTSEEIAQAIESAAKYTEESGVDEIAHAVLRKVGHPLPENDEIASAASTIQRESSNHTC
eukprot:CAMPEP_0196740192 /NCGR_PEP_ID=MMETSP1091-20130531/29787_1 /TAXON_ID=302021 /ORGANISM="Rhodomonas sp., Strain CCMP768" /LENGTH=207 /DNA_ID=CAMNT_0042085195 /DNA_START=62 /DNA_END=685 /DNA_ORIENTATION=+